jgi:hypothetical protein
VTIRALARFQLRSLWTASARLPAWRRPVFLGVNAAALALRFLRLGTRRTRPARAPVRVDDRHITVLLLSYARPANMDLLVRLALRTDAVQRVVVQNNNPSAYRIADVVALRDRRVELRDAPAPTRQGARFLLARAHPSAYYATVDDDVFLSPDQLTTAFEGLLRFPESTHGVRGKIFVGSAYPPWPFRTARDGVEAEVDILNNVYLFTAAHLDEYFRLTRDLGIDDHGAFGNGEDIVLSFSGSRRPRISPVGPVVECASSALPGIATWASHPGFYEERWKLFSTLRARKAFG